MRFGILAALLLLSACAARSPTPQAPVLGTVLEYVVVAEGREQGRLRVMLGERWIRVDEGVSGAGYWLLDRERRRAWRVTGEGRASRLPWPAAPSAGDWTVTEGASRVLFSSGADAARHLQFAHAGQRCLQGVVQPQAPAAVVTGLQWVRLLLPAQAPWRAEGGCAEALAADPLVGFRRGLPLRLWDEAGNGWFLVDHRRQVRLPPVLFKH